MRIGLLITFMGNFGEAGFYNSQEIGLAKALGAFVEHVTVFKLISLQGERKTEAVPGCDNVTAEYIPAKGYGINGMIDTRILDTSLDALLYFSDTQICVPEVYRWAKKNGVKFFPYIGVTESHSVSKIKSVLINSLFYRNINVFKKCLCFAKTPAVQSSLRSKGVDNCVVAPVGLDLALLNEDFASTSVETLKNKWGYRSDEKIILFIGRMTDEKQPIRMIDIFEALHQNDESYRLFMVGKGELLEEVRTAVAERELSDVVRFESQVPNCDIWELYRMSDAFVNLNQQEIFGMAILEAMYYGCKVVAWNAPGPDFIIEDGKSGCLCSSNEEMIDAVINRTIDAEESKRRILEKFTWPPTAKIFANRAFGIK